MIDERLILQVDRMRLAARKALGYVDGLTEQQFLGDEKTKDAVLMNLIVLGESAVRIKQEWPEFVSDRANWPWHEMRGVRNRSAHAYETVDFLAIWRTLQSSLPKLLAELEALGALDPRQ